MKGHTRIQWKQKLFIRKIVENKTEIERNGEKIEKYTRNGKN